MPDDKLDFDALDPSPLGFGSCTSCSYRDVGSAVICYECARRTFEPLAERRCLICDQELPPDSDRCVNGLCNREDRWFGYVWAIAKNTQALQRAIKRYKYGDKWRWAHIFGRVLVGYLDDNVDAFDDVDLIVASPTYMGPGARHTRDHTAFVLQRAAIEAGSRWPFEQASPPLVVKTAETPSMAALGVWERRVVAETDLRDALEVPRPERCVGRRILVFDDVFTDGSTLREVARALVRAGAARVDSIVLARQPWSF